MIEAMIETPAHAAEQKAFSIVGSGVVGVLLANELADLGHEVSVYSHEGMPSLVTDSTSAIAAGQFLPWLPEGHSEGVMANLDLSSIVGFSREFYANLANEPHSTGVMAISNVELLKDGFPWPADLPEAMNVEKRRLESPVMVQDPSGENVPFDTEYRFDTFSINTRKSLAFLAAAAKQKGVNFVKQTIDPNNLAQLDGVIVNAGGLGADKFDPSQTVSKYKGHSIVIRPKDGYMLQQAVSVDDLIMIPREDGTIVCGALYISNPDYPIPKAQEAVELFRRLSKLAKNTEGLVEGMRAGLFENSEVVMHSAGFRVEAGEGGIKVAADGNNERLLHAYGFAGIGWSVGPHFAKVIAREAIKLHK